MGEDMREALQTYKMYGKNIDMKEIEWGGWLKGI